MSKYLTQSGVQDINGYDENQKIMFLVKNPDAVLATREDLQVRGLEKPNSDIQEELEGVNKILKQRQNNNNFIIIIIFYFIIKQRSKWIWFV